jgi:hypothetical protein
VVAARRRSGSVFGLVVDRAVRVLVGQGLDVVGRQTREGLQTRYRVVRLIRLVPFSTTKVTMTATTSMPTTEVRMMPARRLRLSAACLPRSSASFSARRASRCSLALRVLLLLLVVLVLGDDGRDFAKGSPGG